MLPSPRALFNKLFLAIAGLSFIGFADSAYLTAKRYFDLPLPCTITGGCETVLNSPYSMVGPIPLAVFGVAFYLTVMFLALYLSTSDILQPLFVKCLFALAIAGILMSLVFEGIQVFIIHAICQYCLLQAICALCIFILGVWFMRKGAASVR
jgi:uncharacterized membrane protein